MRINAVIAGVFVSAGLASPVWAIQERTEIPEGVVCVSVPYGSRYSNTSVSSALPEALTARLFRDYPGVVIQVDEFHLRYVARPFQILQHTVTVLPSIVPGAETEVMMCLTIRHIGPVAAVAPVTPHLSPVQP